MTFFMFIVFRTVIESKLLSASILSNTSERSFWRYFLLKNSITSWSMGCCRLVTLGGRKSSLIPLAPSHSRSDGWVVTLYSAHYQAKGELWKAVPLFEQIFAHPSWLLGSIKNWVEPFMFLGILFVLYTLEQSATVILSLLTLNPAADFPSDETNVFLGNNLKFSPVSSIL